MLGEGGVTGSSGASRQAENYATSGGDQVYFQISETYQVPGAYGADSISSGFQFGPVTFPFDYNWWSPFFFTVSDGNAVTSGTFTYLRNNTNDSGQVTSTESALGYMVAQTITVSGPAAISSLTAASSATAGDEKTSRRNWCDCSNPDNADVLTFIAINRTAAEEVEAETGLSATFILAWAGWESRYETTQASIFNNNFWLDDKP